MKKYISFFLSLLIVSTLFVGCGKTEVASTVASETADEVVEDNVDDSEESDITIVYTNDVHSYIDNVVTDDEGNVIGDGLRFSKIAAMVNDMRAAGENVLLVDAGDEIQGDIYGAIDEGETIIKIMNETGYQLAAPGNHEFDYGVSRLFQLAEKADFSYVTCNFHSTETKEKIFPDTYTFDIGEKKVAFVGISTPGTMTSSSPVYFQNEKGEFIYTFDGIKDAAELYSSVQNAIDNVRDSVDYVIALGHVGVGLDEIKKGWDSKSIIGNVSGLDAFIDGHSHTTMEGEIVQDKDGKDVVLTQTGNYLKSVGLMTISSDGTISTKLVNDYDKEDEKVASLEKEWIEDVASQLNEKIGVLENDLYITDPERTKRLVRSQEVNLGDFVSDSVYWYFNENLDINCDVAIANGGGIRNEIPKGDLTYMSVKQTQPFGNMICLILATGQQIVDALELGAYLVGDIGDDGVTPAESGGFLQVAGLSYTIDTSVPSSVETDENEMFQGVSGEYRVKDVQIYNKEEGKYEPIDLDKTYQIGGINYILRNSGNGMSMFADNELVVDYVGQDYVILAEYVESFAKEGEFSVVNTKNSPLSKYDGYLLDYEKPSGAGRIQIILE